MSRKLIWINLIGGVVGLLAMIAYLTSAPAPLMPDNQAPLAPDSVSPLSSPVTAMPPSPLVAVWRAYQCDPQPCWHAIRPGITTRQQAKDVLRQDANVVNLAESGLDMITFQLVARLDAGDGQSYAPSGPLVIEGRLTADKNQDTLSEIYLRLNPSPSGTILRMGDTLLLYGQPTTLNYNTGYSTLNVYYGDHLEIYMQPDPPEKSAVCGFLQSTAVTPNLMVRDIFIATKFSLQGPDSPGCRRRWQGFGMYCSSGCL